MPQHELVFFLSAMAIYPIPCIFLIMYYDRLQWRLNKHKASHQLETGKNCHFYNNKKPCPYEDIGCMFKHEKSENCRFNGVCRNKLCPYQHEEINLDKQNDAKNEMKLAKVIEEDDSESDCHEFECNYCEETFEFETEQKMHMENRHCNNCGEYFIAMNTLNIHKKKCT